MNGGIACEAKYSQGERSLKLQGVGVGAQGLGWGGPMPRTNKEEETRGIQELYKVYEEAHGTGKTSKE